MKLVSLLEPSIKVSSPPPGSVNVLVGRTVEGPGGRWVPCATRSTGGVYYSGLFEVGPGKRQVCSDLPLSSADEALSRAIELASTAAA
jgi:hypothetical protein